MKNRVKWASAGIPADACFVQKTKENLRNFVKQQKKDKSSQNRTKTSFLNWIYCTMNTEEFSRKKEVFYMFFYRDGCYNSSCNKKLPNTLREVFLI